MSRLIAFALAFWPVWLWLAGRWATAPEAAVTAGAVGLVACASATGRESSKVSQPSFAALGVTLLYALALIAGLPPLLRAGLAVAALALVALGSTARGGAVACGFALLALPVLPSFEFVFGHPLRAATASIAAWALRLEGLAVVREGALLRWGEQVVVVDVPCSGVRMLWAALLLAVAVAARRGLGAGGLLLSALGAVLLAVLGNALRAAAVFHLESGILALPGSFHEAAGWMTFGLCAAGVVAWVQAIPAGRRPLPHVGAVATPSRFSEMAVLAIAALAPFVPVAKSGVVAPLPAWPTHFEGRALESAPLRPDELRFGADFPGRVGRFRQGNREVVMRWVAAPTRKLHPVAECLKARGDQVRDAPARRSETGLWSCVRVDSSAAGRAPMRICEQVRNPSGESWSSISSWYWAALLGGHEGPWLAVAVAEPIGRQEQAG